jgi:hypothetical protein
MDIVVCPHCGRRIEISQALKHQIEEGVLKEERDRHQEQLEKVKTDIKIETEKRIKEELEFKLKDSRNEIEEARDKNKQLHEQLLGMTKLIRELKDKQERSEIEMQRQLIAERGKIQEEVGRNLQEKNNLEKAELQKQLDDTKKALEEAQRKAAQKSQQLQGEVLELDLEAQLAGNFPTDEIMDVPKGFEGADIIQKVKNKFGQMAGIIVWETKRTKKWDKGWPVKLREDKRRVDASIAILVSDVLPPGIDKFGYFENIWITCYEYALPLANVLRLSLFEIAVAKSTTANKDEKLEALFSYLTKDGFRNKFEAQVESIIILKNDLDAEQRATIKTWKKRETQLGRLMANVAGMYGELQGILGPALPSIPSLQENLLE